MNWLLLRTLFTCEKKIPRYLKQYLAYYGHLLFFWGNISFKTQIDLSLHKSASKTNLRK
jgi:hypothetical protein